MQTFGLVSVVLGVLLLCVCSLVALWAYRRRQWALKTEKEELKRIELQRGREALKHRQLQLMLNGQRFLHALSPQHATGKLSEYDNTSPGSPASADADVDAFGRRSRMSCEIPRSAAAREGPPSARHTPRV